MFNHRINEIFPYLVGHFIPSDIILVESDINTWSKISKDFELNIHYVSTDTNNNFSKNNIPENWNIYNSLIWHKKEVIDYYILSNSLLNGTISSDILKSIWKNIETVNSNLIETINIQEFLDINIFENNNKFLIIDTLDGLNRIKDLDLQKNNIAVIAARVLKKDIENLSKAELDTYMKSRGYKEIIFYKDHYPDMGVAIYIIEYKEKLQTISLSFEEEKNKLSIQFKENETMKNNLSKIEIEYKEKLQQSNQKLESKEKEYEILSKSFEEEKNKLSIQSKENEKIKDDLAKIEIEYKEKLQQSNQKLESKEKEYEILSKSFEEEKNKLSIQSKENEKIKDDLSNIKVLSEKTNNNYNKLISIEKNIRNDINKSSYNTIKQIESFISLQNYLSSNTKLLNFHGWPISPDIALFLIEKIKQHKYDLIIEFGSGTSTLLFSKINKQHKIKDKKIITFEHNVKYYEKTLNLLKSEKLDKYVNLVHAPLVDYTYDKKKYSYYDCNNILKNIELKQNKLKILVLVDGPPGATNPNARFPVLPHLLKYFSKEEIHLVLDDYHRSEEKTISLMWEDLLNFENLDFSSESIPSEKGIYFCEINKEEK